MGLDSGLCNVIYEVFWASVELKDVIKCVVVVIGCCVGGALLYASLFIMNEVNL